MMIQRRQARRLFAHSRLAVAAGLACSAVAVQAFTIETDVPELRLQWDTTVKYTAAARVRSRTEALVRDPSIPNMPNFDDGDRNFSRGLISNRIDILSEADATYRNFGARISGAAWYDSVYRGDSDHDSPATRNVVSRPYPEFGEATRKLHGRKGELLDAFVYGKFDLGEAGGLTMRAGRHTLQWGESLFYGANAIAGGMAPVDVVKALSVPNTQFKELLRPVGQVSSQLQIRPNLALGAYAQYRWEPTRLPGAGSYFSPADITPETGELALPFRAPRAPEVRARNTGQGGLQLRWRPEGTETDLGLYAIRYHDKTPQQFLTLAPAPAGFPPGALIPANYYWVYPEDIKAFGFSASRSIGEYNLGFETSMRRNAPLVSGSSVQIPVARVSSSFARGTTWHANLSVLGSLGPSFIAREASIVAEVAVNYTQKVTENPQAVDPNTERWGAGLRVVYEPTYRQVLDGLDLGVPIGLSYTPAGKSSAGGALGPHHGGDISIGLNATFLDAWRLGLNYTHFYGPMGTFLDAQNHQTFRQTLKDRNFISLSLRRTF